LRLLMLLRMSAGANAVSSGCRVDALRPDSQEQGSDRYYNCVRDDS
jgi:hypothetical protein